MRSTAPRAPPLPPPGRRRLGRGLAYRSSRGRGGGRRCGRASAAGNRRARTRRLGRAGGRSLGGGRGRSRGRRRGGRLPRRSARAATGARGLGLLLGVASLCAVGLGRVGLRLRGLSTLGLRGLRLPGLDRLAGLRAGGGRVLRPSHAAEQRRTRDQPCRLPNAHRHHIPSGLSAGSRRSMTDVGGAGHHGRLTPRTGSKARRSCAGPRTTRSPPCSRD